MLLCTSDAAAAAAVYCCTPAADKHSPDLFPEVLAAAERLADRGGGGGGPYGSEGGALKAVARDPQDTHLLRVYVHRMGPDVQRQVAALYTEALRRREEIKSRTQLFSVFWHSPP